VDGSDAAGWTFGAPSTLLVRPQLELDPAFSPDGRWLAYTSNEPGSFQVYVRPFPDSASQVVVSAQGGRYPQWSPKEQRLFFVGSNSAPAPIYVVDYTIENGSFAPTAPRQWTNRMIMPRRLGLNYALHPDGKRIAAHVAPETPAVATASDRLVLVTNFLDELRRLAPTPR
jgi:Tol biopolymer transport system component